MDGAYSWTIKKNIRSLYPGAGTERTLSGGGDLPSDKRRRHHCDRSRTASDVGSTVLQIQKSAHAFYHPADLEPWVTDWALRSVHRLANPDKQVINIAGDGCFRMNMNEIATAVRREAAVDRSNRQQSCAWNGSPVAGSVSMKNVIPQLFLDDGVDFVKLSRGNGGDRISRDQPGRVQRGF